MNKPYTLATALLCSALLISCGQKTPPAHKAAETESSSAPAAETVQKVERADAPGLTAEYAALRKQQIANVDYQMSVQLDDDSKEFSGRVIATTELPKPLQQPLTIDFTGGKVQSVSVAGKEVPFDYNDYFITLAPEHLKQGENEIAIAYTHPYSTDGSGLHRFQDPEDGNVYLYTHFEPYKANQFFPHFDQPDLKARYTLDVKAPKDWMVVSTAREDSAEEVNGFKHWKFPATKKFSSYIFPLHAGPYVVWEDKAGDIPLRLMARKTLAPNVKPQDWFTFTKQSFEFFQDYFGIEYPFGKYDQLIVPDFTIGAMENVAAVTFNEGYVSRGEKTQAQRQNLANVIAHEMSHMWFGDLVTMKWWNGLWLKESFATYMASLALSENSEFDDVWENFYLGTKQWAYSSDQLVTTHPIEVPVPNTDQAFANFDGITYGKGGSVLKQLPYYLGKEQFRQGVHNYLKEFSYGNSELADFMSHLGKAAGKDLNQWQQEWLYQPGLNTLSAEFQCSDDKISQLTLKQTAPALLSEQQPLLREQKVQLGIYRKGNSSMARVAELPVVYSGASTNVEKAVGLPCPQILYPNDGDWAYVKVALDDKSVQQLSQHINAIESPFTRLMLWQSLYDSAIDAKLPLTDYVQFALNNGGQEQNINVIRLLSRHLQSAAAYLNRMNLAPAEREAQLQAIESFVWQQLQQAPASSDAQKTWFQTFTQIAHSENALNNAQELLAGELQIEGLKLDQDLRWELVILQNRHLHGDYAQLVEQELKADNSDRAQTSAIVAQAVRPTAKAKQQWLDNILQNRDQFKLSQLRAAAGRMYPAEQMALYNESAERIFTALDEVNETADPLLSRSYAQLFPILCDEAGIERYGEALKSHSGLNPTLDKALKNGRQQSEECLAMSSSVQ